MKNIIRKQYTELFSRTFLILLISMCGIITSPITIGATSYTPSDITPELKRPIEIKINSIRQLQNIEIKDRLGTKIYADFDIHYADYTECKVIVQFFNDQGDNLKDSNGLCNDEDGNVIVAKEFYPKYQFQSGYCMDFFMPYEELHLEAGNHEIYFKIFILYNGQIIKESSRTNFYISMKMIGEIAEAYGQ